MAKKMSYEEKREKRHQLEDEIEQKRREAGDLQAAWDRLGTEIEDRKRAQKSAKKSIAKLKREAVSLANKVKKLS